MSAAMSIWFVTQLLPKIGNPKSVGFPGKPPARPQPTKSVGFPGKPPARPQPTNPSK